MIMIAKMLGSKVFKASGSMKTFACPRRQVALSRQYCVTPKAFTPGQQPRIFASTGIYKGKAALQYRPIYPDIAARPPAADGNPQPGFVVEREGVLFFEFAPVATQAGQQTNYGARSYSWATNKITFAMNVLELAQLYDMDNTGASQLEFIHDPNKGKQAQPGSPAVVKRLSVKLNPDNSYMFSVIPGQGNNISVPMKRDEFSELRYQIQALIPQMLGFDEQISVFRANLYNPAAALQERIFAAYTIYKGSAAIGLKVVPPTFKPREGGAPNEFVMDKSGSVVLELAQARQGQGGQSNFGQRSYAWDNKVTIALSPTEFSSLIDVDMRGFPKGDSLDFYHDTNKAINDPNVPKTSKSFKMTASTSGDGFMISVRKTEGQASNSVSCPINRAEYVVYKMLGTYLIPQLTGLSFVA